MKNIAPAHHVESLADADMAAIEIAAALDVLKWIRPPIADQVDACLLHLWAASVLLDDYRKELTEHGKAVLLSTEYRLSPGEWPEPVVEESDLETLEEWFMDSMCEATDGRCVEHDGFCPHGYPSWLLYLSLI